MSTLYIGLYTWVMNVTSLLACHQERSIIHVSHNVWAPLHTSIVLLSTILKKLLGARWDAIEAA